MQKTINQQLFMNFDLMGFKSNIVKIFKNDI